MNYLERVNDSGKPVLIAPEFDLYLERYTDCAHPGLWITVRRPGEYPDACLELIKKVPYDVTGCYYDFIMWMAKEVMPDVRKHKMYMEKLGYPYYLGGALWIVEKENSNIPIVWLMRPIGQEISPVPYWVTDDDKLEGLKKELQKDYPQAFAYNRDENVMCCIPPLSCDEVVGLRTAIQERMNELSMMITDNPSNSIGKDELNWWWEVFCKTEEMFNHDVYFLWHNEFLRMKNLLFVYKNRRGDERVFKAQNAFRLLVKRMR